MVVPHILLFCFFFFEKEGHKIETPILAKVGLAKVGQIRMAKVGLAKVGLSQLAQVEIGRSRPRSPGAQSSAGAEVRDHQNTQLGVQAATDGNFRHL